MKLFAIYVGGEHESAHIEIHDVRFVVARTITESYAQLQEEWWGKPGTLHVDCWAEIDHVDGFDIDLKPEPYSGQERLFFVNLGGYNSRDFAEQHKNMFVIATTVAEAKSKAMSSISEWRDAHRDDFYEAEHAFALDQVIGGPFHIHLASSATVNTPLFTCKYTPLR